MEPSLRKRRIKRALLIALPLVVVLLVAFQRPLAIAWYEMLMRSSQQKAYSNTPPSAIDILIYQAHGIRSSDPEDMYTLSRDKLIKLGCLSRRSYTVQHVGKKPGELQAFQSFASNIFPDAAEVGFSRYGKGQPLLLEICDRPGRIPKWNDFVEHFDAANFGQRLAQARQSRIGNVE